MLNALRMDSAATLYSLHSLKRGWGTDGYRQGAQQLELMKHGLWTSDTFWDYVTSTCVQQSPGAALKHGVLQPPRHCSRDLHFHIKAYEVFATVRKNKQNAKIVPSYSSLPITSGM